MRTWIADYQLVRPIDDDGVDATRDVAGPSQAAAVPAGSGDESAYLARPPERLALGEGPVAVRVLAAATEDGRRRAERRLYELAGVRSPYLPVLYELGTDSGAASGTTEPGRPEAIYWSHSWAGEATMAAPPFTLSVAFVLWLVVGAARGAHALHQGGIAHGGIAPERIRFDERAVCLDLPGSPDAPDGVVRRIGPTAPLDLVDPALVRGALPSRASDIWTLGAVLHRGLTGQLLHPGLGDDPPVTAIQRLMFEPPAISPGVDPEIRHVLSACLAPDPADRPPTAEQLADVLETIGRQR